MLIARSIKICARYLQGAQGGLQDYTKWLKDLKWGCLGIGLGYGSLRSSKILDNLLQIFTWVISSLRFEQSPPGLFNNQGRRNYTRLFHSVFVLQLYKKNPLSRKGSGKTYGDDVKGEPNTALLSTILVLGTFFVAFYMRKFRESHFFGKRVCTRLSCLFYLKHCSGDVLFLSSPFFCFSFSCPSAKGN